jgi:hypothetical protein
VRWLVANASTLASVQRNETLFADVFVEKWLTQAGITTFGPSGIGFANFGLVRDLHLQALIEIGLTLTGISGKKTKKRETERKVVCRIGILNWHL